jgi:hypothetical protein
VWEQLLNQDYIDVDVAYLLGMIFAHGKLMTQPGNVRRLIIEIPIRQDLPRMPPGTRLPFASVAAENERALACARRRVNDLLEVNVDVTTSETRKTATLAAVFTKRTIAWRNLECLCSRGVGRSSFLLPEFFFDFPAEIQEEFIRGYADAGVTPNAGDYMPSKRGKVYRIAFPVVYPNLRLARQLVLLFERLGLRPGLLLGDPARRGGRAREHRVRLKAEEYSSIGFSQCFRHKQAMLDALAKANKANRRVKRGAHQK